MRQAQQRTFVGVHHNDRMQVKTPAASGTDHGGVLDRQHMAARAPLRRAAGSLGRHRLGRHRLVAQQPGQTDLPGPIASKPTDPNPSPSRRHQTGMQEGPPFSRRRSPNRPSVTSDIVCSGQFSTRESDSPVPTKRRCVNAVAPSMGGG